MSEFFAMGGYAFFVWSSYGFFAVVMLWLGLAPMLKARKLKEQLEDQIARETQRRNRYDTDT